jgi:nucleoredoxin
VTYHFLPDALVPDDDVITEETGKDAANIASATAKFDIPVADDYFMGLLGTELLTKTGASTPSSIDTPTALANNRLVALYFSAHWCGPCRGFTPMLIEFYNYLKEEVSPTHGLEIIFVSSDRNEAEFQQYYQGMPFKAIPFRNRTLAQQIKSVFGVRGIPSLVVIDAMSGRIVVSQEDSRQEVHQACNRGEQAIEALFKTWLDKVPAESKAMLDILALSCEEAEKTIGADSDKVDCTTRQNQKASDYLIRKKAANNADDSAAIVKSIFTELVANGTSPNEAAAEAIKRTTQQPLGRFEGTLKGVGSIADSSEAKSTTIVKAAEVLLHLNAGDKSKITNIVTTAKKYVTNALKEPTNSRFRSFRLSNKVFDQITSVAGSIQLLTCIGFSVFPSDADFVAAIPLYVDLKAMADVLDTLLEVYSN